MKILFAASEAYPLIKTGGLGDVAHSLPNALQKLGNEVRVILPAYRTILEQCRHHTILGWTDLHSGGHTHTVRILAAEAEHFPTPLLLVDCAALFDRPGNPYQQPDGYDWHDNGERFALFSHAVAQVASGEIDIGWQADVVHSNDWQTGLVAAFLSQMPKAPPSLFTIHNLAYRGIFPHEDFVRLGLPAEWWSSEGVEYYHNFSMLKAGIVYAGQLTTVSPSYAEEILTPEFGYGFEGILQTAQKKLSGILNGIDSKIWNPQSDRALAQNYSLKNKYLAGKRANKSALLKEFGLSATEAQLKAPLIGFIGRLVEQKGIDLIVSVIPKLLKTSPANFVLIGSGDPHHQRVLQQLAITYPKRVMVRIGYDEELAHLIEAGADLFVMPSRFEPCGLNQLYSLRYGTPPVVYSTGGLRDTVIDANEENLANKTATGFVFNHSSPKALQATIERALKLFQKPLQWRALIRSAMAQDFGWERSAQQYQLLYNKLRQR